MVPSQPSRATHPDRHALVLWAVVALAIIAGCSGPGGDPGATPTDTPPPNVDAAAVAEQARAFADAVAAYNGTSTLNVTQQANNVNRTVDVHIERRVDRAANRLMLRQTSSVAGQTSEVGIWLVNETLYQRSEAFERTYGSSWIERNVSGNVSALFRQWDPLESAGVMLGNASVSVEGTAEVRGRATYVLQADVDEAAFERYAYGENATDSTVEQLSARVWVTQDEGRILRMTATIVEKTQGQAGTVTLDQEVENRFHYPDGIRITVPDGASEAVPADDGP